MKVAETLSFEAAALMEILHRKDKDGKLVISLDVLDSFMRQYQEPRNSLTPQTYNYFHTQNMTGANLIGFYANGASLHAKSQETQLRLSDQTAFTVDGVKMQSLHEQWRYSNVNEKEIPTELIQDVLSEFQAAAVDNAKDPILPDLYQDKTTAPITLLMIRLGMSHEQIAFLYSAVSHGLPRKAKIVRNVLSQFGLPSNGPLSITTQDMLQAQLYAERFPKAYNAIVRGDQEQIKDAVGRLGMDVFRDMLGYVAKAVLTYMHIEGI